MSAFKWPKAPSSDEAQMLSMFSLSGPLPPVSGSECPDHFQGSAEAHEHYIAYRSHEASVDTRVFHATFAEDVAGFIAFSMKVEQHAGSMHVVPHVDYAYMLPQFKRYGMNMLIQPLIEDVLSVVNQVEVEDKLNGVRIRLSRDLEPDGRAKFFEALNSQLRAMARKRHGVLLMG